ncbi:hypothetical protein C8R44DRAFT_879462 [Mycena epipterygia]|nr:hypothetical protein C8R44DRAFT_879462 [Mycena epipterygia]
MNPLEFQSPPGPLSATFEARGKRRNAVHDCYALFTWTRPDFVSSSLRLLSSSFPSEMHRCLQIREILDMFFEPADSYGTLAALARTCTTFQNPALDILWRNQDTLMNLLRCMPTDLFSEEARYGLKNTSTLTTLLRLLRPIVASDWERPRLYLHRVRAIISGTTGGVSLAEVFPALSAFLKDDCLFPNLSALHWWHDNRDFPYIYLFLTSTITNLSVSSDGVDSHLSLLSALPRKCPALKDVSVFLRHNPDQLKTLSSTVQNSLSIFIRALQHLEQLSIWVPDVAALEHIGRMPTLRSLELTTLPVAFASSPSSQTSMFVNLRHLALSDVDVQSATKFLQMCADAGLKSFEVEFTAPATSNQMENFAGALAQCSSSHSTLTYLTIDHSYGVPGTWTNMSYIMDTKHLRTLFCFSQLQQICIIWRHKVDLDDATVSDMARAWPCLEILKLPEPIHPRVTLHSFPILARHCPHLRTLRMSFDTSGIPWPTNGTPPGTV